MPVRGVRMSENSMTPSGLNACHGCREISTYKCRQVGPFALSDVTNAQPSPWDAGAASARLAHKNRQRCSRVTTQRHAVQSTAAARSSQGSICKAPVAISMEKPWQGAATAVSCVRLCRGQDSICKALTQVDITAAAQSSMQPPPVASKSCEEAPDPAVRLCHQCRPGKGRIYSAHRNVSIL